MRRQPLGTLENNQFYFSRKAVKSEEGKESLQML